MARLASNDRQSDSRNFYGGGGYSGGGAGGDLGPAAGGILGGLVGTLAGLLLCAIAWLITKPTAWSPSEWILGAACGGLLMGLVSLPARDSIDLPLPVVVLLLAALGALGGAGVALVTDWTGGVRFPGWVFATGVLGIVSGAIAAAVTR